MRPDAWAWRSPPPHTHRLHPVCMPGREAPRKHTHTHRSKALIQLLLAAAGCHGNASVAAMQPSLLQLEQQDDMNRRKQEYETISRRQRPHMHCWTSEQCSIHSTVCVDWNVSTSRRRTLVAWLNSSIFEINRWLFCLLDGCSEQKNLAKHEGSTDTLVQHQVSADTHRIDWHLHTGR